MNQFELTPETRDVLDRIRHSSKFLSIFEMPSDLAEAAVWEIGKIVLADRGLPLVQHNGYRWYLREMSKLLRTKTEWDLALEMEICLRKWAAYSLDSELLQTLLRECYDRIGAMTPEQIEENPKPETRMTNQARTAEPDRPEFGNQKPEFRAAGENSTTKTQRHEEDTLGKRTSTDYADYTDCAPASGTNNEERRTMNVPLTAGGANA